MASPVGEIIDGDTPESLAEQYRIALTNIANIPADDGTSPANIVKLTTCPVEPLDPAMRKVRGSEFGDIAPATALLLVARHTAPEYLIEFDYPPVRVRTMDVAGGTIIGDTHYLQNASWYWIPI